MDTEQKQDTQDKKKKVYKILKRIGQALIIIISIILIANNCKKAHAEETPINYRSYNMIVSIDDRYYDTGITTGHITVLATVTPTEITYIQVESNTIPEFIADDADILSGPTETYGATEILYGHIYFIQTNEQYTYANDYYTIIGASELNTFYKYIMAQTRSEAYASALTDNKETIYNEGYDNGVRDTADSANQQMALAKITYQTQIADLEAQLRNAQATIEAGGTWANLKNLLSLIFLFPLRFFKEGMDVNIFGINIGGFILGIFMIGLTLTIIGIILGRRKA